MARAGVRKHPAELPGVLQSTGRRSLARLQAPGRQFARLGTGPAGAQEVAGRAGTPAARRWWSVSARTSAPLVPSTTASVRRRWRDSSIVVRRRLRSRSAPASTASAPLFATSSVAPCTARNRRATTGRHSRTWPSSRAHQRTSRPGRRLCKQTGQQYWQQLFTQFDQLRTGRLVAFLRGRDPDAMVGYSILIYRLTDADVALALNGPPPNP